MTKHEAARRDDQRRASLAANHAEPARGWVARKAPPPTDKLLLGYADLQACGISYSRQHLYRKMADGTFPKPVALGSAAYSRKAWRRADIMEWLGQLQPAD
jgi:predicted DNA-binding transcriptional regulator AlpA